MNETRVILCLQKEKKELGQHKWKRQVGGSKPRERDASLHAVLGTVTALSSPWNVKIYLAQKNLENSWKRVYTKTCFGPDSPWTMSHWSLGKYCWEILLHTHLACTLWSLHSLLPSPCSWGHCIAMSRHRDSSKLTFCSSHPCNIETSNWRWVWH